MKSGQEYTASTASDDTQAAAQRLAAVRTRIRSAEQCYGRAAGSVSLLAVSKFQDAQAIRTLYGLGQRAFGENYVQEALGKMGALADLAIEWHLIGPLQSNKSRLVAEHFAWVHSVDRVKLAERLSAQRPRGLPPLQICLQINISGEESKSGVAPSELPALAAAIQGLPGLALRGLMTIPAAVEGFEAQRAQLRRMREALDGVARQGIALDTLSMGMSDDLEAAVAEGATLVRVGTALFGKRGVR